MTFTRRVLGLGVALLAVLAVAFPITTSAAGDPNNFTIQSFDADYYLTRSADKRSSLRITEKITVQYRPNSVSHGIERAIPQKYDGHKVRMSVASVKDDKGKNWQYTTYDSNGNTVVRIGNPNAYATGVQTYVINYDQHDVTKNFDDHDEFYWDTNGTDWGQSFGSVTARLHLNGTLAKSFTNMAKCFEGSLGSTGSCSTSEVRKDNETVVTFKSSRMLYAGENVTMVAGFNKGTFAKYQPTAWERAFKWAVIGWLFIGAFILLCVITAMSEAWGKHGRSPAGKGTIVPEYIPPKDLSVLSSSTIVKRKGSDVTAQILDLAVRHYLRIYETETKGTWFTKKKSYEVELIRKLTGLRNEEKRLVTILFGDDPTVGQRITLEGIKSKLYKETTKLEKDVEKQLLASGFLADLSETRKKYYKVGALIMVLGIVTINPLIFVASLIALIVAANFHPLTEKGVASRDYLKGLEMYMKLAEAERIAYLQSPEGAVKTKVNPKNNKRMVELYERLLPYAIIFGQEKKWAKEFAPLYKDAPDWYVGNWNTFNAAVFVGSLNNFSVVSNNTFSAPTSSSSSGFSSGGGFSGGGGGGGGGGGW